MNATPYGKGTLGGFEVCCGMMAPSSGVDAEDYDRLPAAVGSLYRFGGEGLFVLSGRGCGMGRLVEEVISMAVVKAHSSAYWRGAKDQRVAEPAARRHGSLGVRVL